MNWLKLDPLIREALNEDLGRGDVTTEAIIESIGGSVSVAARVMAKQPLILAGWPVFVRVFNTLGSIENETSHAEGSQAGPGLLGVLKGPAEVILSAERVALNLLQRCCGIATETRRLVEKVAHTKTQILDTRKTAPGWGILDKYAVRVGRGRNHRMGLDDGLLIKENHVALAGGVGAAVQAARRRANHLQKIELEVRNFEELELALQCRVDVILLDNMSPVEIRQAVERSAGRCVLEVSGGITESNLVDYAESGADFISLGALTHSVRACDISLLIEQVN